MTFISKLGSPSSSGKFTTENFFIGTPEAEGETAVNSKIKLGEIFGDFLNVFPELSTVKFIITGRKGAGKSALAEYIHFSAGNDSSVFCDFIKTRDLDIQKIVQLGIELGKPIEEKVLFEWIILTKLVKQFTEDNSVQGLPEFKNLKNFLSTNSGMVDINSYEIEEIIKQKSFEINIEYFKRVFSSVLGKSLSVKEHKAPFYKILKPLQEVVLKILLDNKLDKNSYYLIFDDLDIDFKENDINSINRLTSLLRIAKDYNIDFFGKNGLDCKIIILLRDDIKRIIVNHNADTAKIFSSYEIPLIWYEHEKYKVNENEVGIKKLINKRIESNFISEELSYNKNDPWSSLILDDSIYNGSSFKHIIDYTFFRPRDLILFFKPLPRNRYKIPINVHDLKNLIFLYVEEVVLEIKNELSASFTNADIVKIFQCLGYFSRRGPFSYDDIFDEFEKLDLSYDVSECIELLFNYSLVGNFDGSNSYVSKIYFKHREKVGETLVIDYDLDFIIHKCLQVYFDKRKA
jgi:hypothetical protein